MSASSSRGPRAGRRSVSPCGIGRDSGSAATAAAAAGGTAAASATAASKASGGNGGAVKEHERANGNGSSAGAERCAERDADTGTAGSDPRDRKSTEASSDSANNGAGSRGMLDDTALSEEGFSRAKPEGYGGVGDGGRGAQRQGGGEGGWKWFGVGVGFGASAAVLAAAVATSGKVKLGRVRFLG